jgi:hypothetical protein
MALLEPQVDACRRQAVITWAADQIGTRVLHASILKTVLKPVQ